MYGRLMPTKQGYIDGKCYHILNTYGSYGEVEMTFRTLEYQADTLSGDRPGFPLLLGYNSP